MSDSQDKIQQVSNSEQDDSKQIHDQINEEEAEKEQIGKHVQSIEIPNSSRARGDSDISSQKKTLPEILRRPTERKYGQEIIEQQQKQRQSQTGKLSITSDVYSKQQTTSPQNKEDVQKQDQEQYFYKDKLQVKNNVDEEEEVPQIKRGNQSSLGFINKESDTESMNITNIDNKKVQKSYTSFSQQIKGGVYTLNRNNNSSYGGRKTAHSQNQIEKIGDIMIHLDKNSQSFKKSLVQISESGKQSSTYKSRPTSASVDKKIKEDKMEAYNRLYHVDENISDVTDHMIVNFNANYYNKKKPVRAGINNTTTNFGFYKKKLIDQKNQLTSGFVEATLKLETEKQLLTKKQLEQKRFTTSGQNSLRIRKLESQKPIKETPLTLSKKINTIDEAQTPNQTNTVRKSKVEINEKKDLFDTQNLGIQDSIQINSQSTKNKNELDNYKLGPQIGKGSYAIVRLATDINTNDQVAIKFYDKYKLFDPQKKKNVQREISILKQISHPHCIGLQKTFENSKSICVIMEYLGKDSLYTYLKTFEGRKLPEDEAKRIFKQIIKGVNYLHQNNIIHRDMKLENLLMDDTRNIKIIDFGFSINVPSDKKLNIFCGTPSYMAPEIVSKKEYYGPPVDIWACGILLYVMLVGTFPFKAADDKTLYFKIKNGNYDLPSHVSVGARQLLKKILNVNYHERATAEEILLDTWISPMNIVKKIDELRAQIKQRQSQLTQQDEDNDD